MVDRHHAAVDLAKNDLDTAVDRFPTSMSSSSRTAICSRPSSTCAMARSMACRFSRWICLMPSSFPSSSSMPGSLCVKPARARTLNLQLAEERDSGGPDSQRRGLRHHRRSEQPHDSGDGPQIHGNRGRSGLRAYAVGKIKTALIRVAQFVGVTLPAATVEEIARQQYDEYKNDLNNVRPRKTPLPTATVLIRAPSAFPSGSPRPSGSGTPITAAIWAPIQESTAATALRRALVPPAAPGPHPNVNPNPDPDDATGG